MVTNWCIPIGASSAPTKSPLISPNPSATEFNLSSTSKNHSNSINNNSFKSPAFNSTSKQNVTGSTYRSRYRNNNLNEVNAPTPVKDLKFSSSGNFSNQISDGVTFVQSSSISSKTNFKDASSNKVKEIKMKEDGDLKEKKQLRIITTQGFGERLERRTATSKDRSVGKRTLNKTLATTDQLKRRPPSIIIPPPKIKSRIILVNKPRKEKTAIPFISSTLRPELQNCTTSITASTTSKSLSKQDVRPQLQHLLSSDDTLPSISRRSQPLEISDSTLSNFSVLSFPADAIDSVSNSRRSSLIDTTINRHSIDVEQIPFFLHSTSSDSSSLPAVTIPKLSNQLPFNPPSALSSQLMSRSTSSQGGINCRTIETLPAVYSTPTPLRKVSEVESIRRKYENELEHRSNLLSTHVKNLAELNASGGSVFVNSLVDSIERSDKLAEELHTALLKSSMSEHQFESKYLVTKSELKKVTEERDEALKRLEILERKFSFLVENSKTEILNNQNQEKKVFSIPATPETDYDELVGSPPNRSTSLSPPRNGTTIRREVIDSLTLPPILPPSSQTSLELNLKNYHSRNLPSTSSPSISLSPEIFQFPRAGKVSKLTTRKEFKYNSKASKEPEEVLNISTMTTAISVPPFVPASMESPPSPRLFRSISDSKVLAPLLTIKKSFSSNSLSSSANHQHSNSTCSINSSFERRRVNLNSIKLDELDIVEILERMG